MPDPRLRLGPRPPPRTGPRLSHQPCRPLPRPQASWDRARLPPEKASPWRVVGTRPRGERREGPRRVWLEHTAPGDQHGLLLPARRPSRQKLRPTPKPLEASAANSRFSPSSVVTNCSTKGFKSAAHSSSVPQSRAQLYGSREFGCVEVAARLSYPQGYPVWGYGHPRGGVRREPGGGPPPHSPRAPCLLRIGTGPGRGRPSRKCQAQAGAGGLDRRGWHVANER